MVSDIEFEKGTGFENMNSNFENFSLEQVSSDEHSFWSSDGYINVVKRMEASSTMCNFFANMTADYASLEAKYAKDLNDLAEKYSKSHEKLLNTFPKDCLLYGTWGKAFDGMLNHVSSISRSHMENWTTLHANCITPLINYQTNNLIKPSGLYLLKDLKEEFKDAQKPLLDILADVTKSKEKYFSLLCQEEKSQTLSGSNKVLNDKKTNALKKTRKLEKKRRKYHDLCEHMQLIIPLYKENTRKVFDRCQVIEQLKLRVFHCSIDAFCKVTSFKNNKRYFDAVRLFEECVSKIDIEEDLDNWNMEYGPASEFSLIKYDRKIQRETPSRSFSISKFGRPFDDSSKHDIDDRSKTRNSAT